MALAPCPRWGSEVGDRGRPNITWGGARCWNLEERACAVFFCKVQANIGFKGDRTTEHHYATKIFKIKLGDCSWIWSKSWI
jgi:hypothetical protein